MEKKVTRRTVADKTRENILKAARKLFADTGFSGTSTAAIARAAKVNEALIFHHFKNKAELWKKVKARVIEDIPLELLNPKPDSVRIFLEAAINQRVQAYQNNPELIRLLQWQHMEMKQNKLFAGNKLAPDNWLEPIAYLQKTGKIKTSVKPEFIMIWLVASINVLIFDRLQLFQDESNRQDYIKFLLVHFERGIS